MTQATTTNRATINSLIERRDRSVQTAFVASVVAYDRATQTADLRPQHLEVWTAEEDPVALPDLSNVPVLFPGGGGYSITWDLSTSDFVLVTCTKYSLDVWRQRAEVSDPGDFRKFGLSGAVAHPVRMFANGGETDQVSAGNLVIAGPEIHLGKADPAVFIALANLVNAEFDKVETAHNAHTHAYVAPGPANALTSGPTSNPAGTPPAFQYTSADVDSAKVKSE